MTLTRNQIFNINQKEIEQFMERSMGQKLLDFFILLPEDIGEWNETGDSFVIFDWGGFVECICLTLYGYYDPESYSRHNIRVLEMFRSMGIGVQVDIVVIPGREYETGKMVSCISHPLLKRNRYQDARILTIRGPHSPQNRWEFNQGIKEIESPDAVLREIFPQACVSEEYVLDDTFHPIISNE